MNDQSIDQEFYQLFCSLKKILEIEKYMNSVKKKWINLLRVFRREPYYVRSCNFV